MSFPHTIRLSLLLLVVLLALLCSGCARKLSADAYDRNYALLKDAAEKHLASGEYGAAYVLSRVLLDSDPGDSRAIEIRQEAIAQKPTLAKLDSRKVLGSNFAMRETRNISTTGKVLLWPVNFFTDLLDIITVEVGVCLGVGAKAQVTDAAAAGAQISAGQTTIGFRNRHPGVRASIENFLDILPIQLRALAETAAGTHGVYALSYGGAGTKWPKARPYQQARDYWSIGAQAEAGIIAANVEVHPIQLWDWITGLVFFDSLNDNIGPTKGIRLDSVEKEVIKSLLTNKKPQR